MKEYNVRLLNENDIDDIVKARVSQETDMGMTLTDKYVEAYRNVMLKLFKENKILGVGAYDNQRLVSIAFMNYLNYGKPQYLPYCCAVWTDKKYRGQGLFGLVHDKLVNELNKNPQNFQDTIFATIDGGEKAFKAMAKNGYYLKSGEMSFLGDVLKNDNIKVLDSKNVLSWHKQVVYGNSNEALISIVYSAEQLFAHPANMDGKMVRIVDIAPLKSNLTIDEFKKAFTNFLADNRFCKLNINEFGEGFGNLLAVLELENNEEFANLLASLDFEGHNFKKCDNIIERPFSQSLKLK